MKRQFATPVAFRQAVEQRLLNEALRDGHDVHRVRQPRLATHRVLRDG